MDEGAVDSAFVDTDLETRLHERRGRRGGRRGADDRPLRLDDADGRERGFDTRVVRDATASFDRERELDGDRLPADESHLAARARPSGKFATVVSTADVLATAADG